MDNNNSRKFDGVDYKNTFAKSISTMYELVGQVLSAQICNGDHILDIGGGPGMGARIIDEMRIKATLTGCLKNNILRHLEVLRFFNT